MNNHCTICKFGQYYAKGLCKLCYQRERRQKNRKTKVGIPNSTCVCGSKAVSKGLCRKCYAKNYQQNVVYVKLRKLSASIKLNKTKEKMTKDRITFDNIIQMVKNGYTIDDASFANNITRSYLYKNMTNEEKSALTIAKKTAIPRKYIDNTDYEDGEIDL